MGPSRFRKKIEKSVYKVFLSVYKVFKSVQKCLIVENGRVGASVVPEGTCSRLPRYGIIFEKGNCAKFFAHPVTRTFSKHSLLHQRRDPLYAILSPFASSMA